MHESSKTYLLMMGRAIILNTPDKQQRAAEWVYIHPDETLISPVNYKGQRLEHTRLYHGYTGEETEQVLAFICRDEKED